jgi:hypothetical protein
MRSYVSNTSIWGPMLVILVHEVIRKKRKLNCWTSCAYWLTVPCCPLCLGGKIMKNCTSYNNEHHHSLRFVLVRGLTKFSKSVNLAWRTNMWPPRRSSLISSDSFLLGWTKEDIQLSKSRTLEQKIRDMFVAVPLGLLRPNGQCVFLVVYGL